MLRRSPLKHRHDGTSPLPLGLDWSPPPRTWNGRETVWPHDPRTGWSYCITIPSWIVLAKSRDSDPIVFYRVQVGLQSPDGVTTSRTVLRRFNDFLKLHAALKRTFQRKNLPPPPPKGILRMKTRPMLEERRCLLEEWMSKLLSDLESSRSVVIASFLELEAAARSSFQEEGQPSSGSQVSVSPTVSPLHTHPNISISLPAVSSSLTSDCGSDTAYETSEIGTPSLGRDNNSDIGIEDLSFDDDLTGPVDKFVKYGMSNIDEGLSMGHAILEQLESFPKQKLHVRDTHSNLEHNTSNETSPKVSNHTVDMLELLSEPDHGTVIHHSRRLSNESGASDRSSQRGSELSNLAVPSSNGYLPVDFSRGADISKTIGTFGHSDYQFPHDVQLLLPQDQRQKMHRILTTMHRRLITAKTDMEDLISRLNQEIAVKCYLATKLKDLEVELETTKQKSKENLEQAILIERERVTQMQWDMEELRRRSMEMELKLNSQQAQNRGTQSINSPSIELKDELDSAKHQFEALSKRYQELEVKSKADVKVLVKEVKSLRSSQAELKQQLIRSLEEKSMAEEKETIEQARTCWRNMLYKCKILHEQLQECNCNNLMCEKGDDLFTKIASLSNPSDLITASNSQIALLLDEVRHLSEEVGCSATTISGVIDSEDSKRPVVEELVQMLTCTLVDNGELRKQLNSLILNYAIRTSKAFERIETETRPNVSLQSDPDACRGKFD